MCFGIFSNPSLANADTVWLNGKAEPVFGLIVEEKESGTLEFDKFIPSENRFVRIEFTKDDIAVAVQTIDQKRLSALSIDELSKWCNYTEELLRVSNDPVARSTAFRLVLLCIHHGSSQKGEEKSVHNAAYNLPLFASTPREKSTFLKVAYLYTGNHSLLQKANKPPEDRDLRVDIELRLVQSVRRQQFNRASTLMNSSGFKSIATKRISPTLLTNIQTAIADKKIESQLLQKLIELEKTIQFSRPQAGKRQDQNLLERQNSGELNIPLLHEISPFDLEATVFSNGRWRRPDSPMQEK